MGDIDIYADVVASLAMVVAAGSLGWQIKASRWDRPNIVFGRERVGTQTETVGGHQSLGWLTEVTVTNTGNAETTLLSVEWEFDFAPSDEPSIFVAGNLGDDGLTIDTEELAPGIAKTTYHSAAFDTYTYTGEFQPIVLGRDHSRRFTYRIGPYALDRKLGQATRARPVACFIKRRGEDVQYGNWLPAPSTRP